jgi:hypothetical protein
MRALVIVCAAAALAPRWPRPDAPPAVERVEHFRDGPHEYTVRTIAEPSRRVHPAEECYRATGWKVRPLPMRIETWRWGCFEATRGAERAEVCETFVDRNGRSWSDAGSWWWSAMFARGSGPWRGMTRVTR